MYIVKKLFLIFFFFFIEPPDIPEKITVEVTGNDSVRISCIEADNPDSAICTKFNGQYHI